MNQNNVSEAITLTLNLTETLEDLNARYAQALTPLSVTFGLFTLFGFLGNLLILVVFSLSRDYKRNNFKVFVLTLGVIDIITCVTLIPAEIVKQQHYFSFGDEVPCKIKCFFNVFGASSSCLALLVISVDRYRKVCQPFKKQMNPELAVRILLGVAFLFPILLAIPGTIMCGIKTTEMRNKYGTTTTIQLCETEERFEKTVWRAIYKWVFVMLLCGISLAYIVLYTFVMIEATKQIRAIARQRQSSFDVTFSSGIYEPNAIVHEPMNGSQILKMSPETDGLMSSNGGEGGDNEEETETSGTVAESRNKNVKHSSNGLLRLADLPKKKLSKQISLRSIRSQTQLVKRREFPTKTLIWFILTIVFIITYLAHIILALKVDKIVFMTPREFSSFSFFFRIYFFNHMINPIVYAIFVKRFRTSCKNILPTMYNKLRQCIM
ncbi:alpha-2A adrenergic receptor-like [Dreissena polymorpha]|uniref:G-protein coupled receptors family 1 profile domain-containing protein n=1 Tax=Dreissena polymorpha TaxID=45954 RepID=A0A9D4FU39_DREPO|nr:alpha-2A adrenergic receptor-like [Dreissena polymorpha]KAH3803051.1 hypothetical protein DPMN_156750 [Dreissena polymorpha]